ncbi:MAG: hypothetical protein ACP5LM_01060 [Thermoplasmata archaeon]|jgi:hypothetical protein
MMSLKKILAIIIILVVVLVVAFYFEIYYSVKNATFWGNAPQTTVVPINVAFVNLSTIEKIYNTNEIKNYTHIYNVSKSNLYQIDIQEIYQSLKNYSSLSILFQQMDSPAQAYFPFQHALMPLYSSGTYKVFEYKEFYLPHFHKSIFLIYYYEYLINITGTGFFENPTLLQQVGYDQMDIMLS